MIKRLLTFLLVFCFISEQTGIAQASPMGVPASLGLPALNAFRPVQLRSVEFDPASDNFQLFLDKGVLAQLSSRQIDESAQELFDYFQTGLSLPNSMFWVNLRPDSPERIVEPYLENTDLGRTLLEADLQLKKDVSRFTSPEIPEGRKYWDKLYAKAEELFGAQEVDIPTYTRPWIVPGEIIIRANATGAFIYKAALKVKLEQDYMQDSSACDFSDQRNKALNAYSAQLMRELIIPRLTREVNSSYRYSRLRQVYYSLVLAQWFKGDQHLRGREILSRHIDNKDLSGLRSKTGWSKDTYYQAYRDSVRQGEYSKEESVRGRYGVRVRQYFSGGLMLDGGVPPTVVAGSDDSARDALQVNGITRVMPGGRRETFSSDLTGSPEWESFFASHNDKIASHIRSGALRELNKTGKRISRIDDVRVVYAAAGASKSIFKVTVSFKAAGAEKIETNDLCLVMLKPEAHPFFHEQFQAELDVKKRYSEIARAGNTVDPKLVPVPYDDTSVRIEDVSYYLQEWIDGITLEDKLGAAGTGKFDLIKRSLSSWVTICSVLGSYVKDPTSRNIMLRAGTEEGFVVVDFGYMQKLERYEDKFLEEFYDSYRNEVSAEEMSLLMQSMFGQVEHQLGSGTLTAALDYYKSHSEKLSPAQQSVYQGLDTFLGKTKRDGGMLSGISSTLGVWANGLIPGARFPTNQDATYSVDFRDLHGWEGSIQAGGGNLLRHITSRAKEQMQRGGGGTPKIKSVTVAYAASGASKGIFKVTVAAEPGAGGKPRTIDLCLAMIKPTSVAINHEIFRDELATKHEYRRKAMARNADLSLVPEPYDYETTRVGINEYYLQEWILAGETLEDKIEQTETVDAGLISGSIAAWVKLSAILGEYIVDCGFRNIMVRDDGRFVVVDLEIASALEGRGDRILDALHYFYVRNDYKNKPESAWTMRVMFEQVEKHLGKEYLESAYNKYTDLLRSKEILPYQQSIGLALGRYLGKSDSSLDGGQKGIEGFVGGEDQYWLRFPQQLVKRLEKLDKESVVVDLGSATGNLGAWLAQQNSKFRVLGLEKDPTLVSTAVKIARDKNVAVIEGWRTNPLNALRASASAAVAYQTVDVVQGLRALADQSVDAVIMHRLRDSIRDLDERVLLIKEIERVLRPGGWISLVEDLRVEENDPEGDWYQERYAFTAKMIPGLVKAGIIDRIYGELSRNPDVSLILSLRDAAGNKIDELTGFEDENEILSAIIDKRIVVRGVGIHERKERVRDSFQEQGFNAAESWHVLMPERGERQGHNTVMNGMLFQKAPYDGVGGANDLSGIDFRSLPVRGRPSADQILMAQLARLSENSRMNDLDREWKRISKQIGAGNTPYGRIKEYIAVCLNRDGCRKYLAGVAEFVMNELKREEEQAIVTRTELKDLLMCLR